MQSYPDLPEEIMMEILARLPVKSIGKCRCVSKPWRMLLLQPGFVKSHLDRVKAAGDQSLLLLTSSSSRESLSPVPFSATELSSPGQMFGGDYWSHIRGSCDGLLLVEDGAGKLFVVNPVTRRVKEVPESPSGVDPTQGSTVVGFGYDSVGDDYKIVVISFYDPCITLYTADVEDGFDEGKFVSVYSLKIGRWKRVEHGCPVDHHDQQGNRSHPGVFVNGCVHWIGSRGNDFVIISFSLTEEKFLELPPPPGFLEGSRFDQNRLGVLGGCLAMIDIRQRRVWVMKEYGVQETWTMFMINRYIGQFVCFVGPRHVVVTENGKYVVHDLKRGSTKEIHGGSDGVRIEGSFMESLVSPL